MPVISAFRAFQGQFFVLREVMYRPLPDGVAVAVPADRPKRVFRLGSKPADMLQRHAESQRAPPSFGNRLFRSFWNEAAGLRRRLRDCSISERFWSNASRNAYSPTRLAILSHNERSVWRSASEREELNADTASSTATAMGSKSPPQTALRHSLKYAPRSAMGLPSRTRAQARPPVG